MAVRIPVPEIKTYSKDDRKSIKELYESFRRLDSEFWTFETISVQKAKVSGRKRNIPIIAFMTKRKGPALWIISGIHGEEPAGPNAIAENIGFLNDLAQKIPIVLIPLCNPAGYIRNWRYSNLKRASRKKRVKPNFVGTASCFLQDEKNPKKARSTTPCSLSSLKFTYALLRLTKKRRPQLLLDFHEDQSSTSQYIYSQGKLAYKDPIAKEIVSMLIREGFNLRMKGKTRFGEKIVNGIVSGVRDDSIDELLSAKNIILNNKIERGPYTKSVIVVETRTKGVPIEKRIAIQSEIILLSKRYYEIARAMKNK